MAYSDVSELGHNYVTLQDVLTSFNITVEDDDYASGAEDSVIRHFAQRGIRELGFDVTSRICSIKLPVNSNDTVTLPDDFVDMIKVGLVGADGYVRVLRENKDINISRRYERDLNGNNTNETNDSAEGPLNVSDNLILDREDSRTSTTGTPEATTEDVEGQDSFIFRNYIYNNSLGRLYGVGGGQGEGFYRMNLDQNRIDLQNDTSAQEVVIEYIRDEARSTNPVIHVYAEEALQAFIYWKLVSRKSTVPANEKARARNEFYNEKRKARHRMSNITKEELLAVSRRNFKLAPKY